MADGRQASARFFETIAEEFLFINILIKFLYYLNLRIFVHLYHQRVSLLIIIFIVFFFVIRITRRTQPLNNKHVFQNENRTKEEWGIYFGYVIYMIYVSCVRRQSVSSRLPCWQSSIFLTDFSTPMTGLLQDFRILKEGKLTILYVFGRIIY